MAKGLLIDKKNSKKYKELSMGLKKDMPFTTQGNVHIAAALIALKLNLHSKQPSNKYEIIRGKVLNEMQWKVVRQIGVAATEDPEILLNEDKQLDIINGLANSGILELYRIITKNENGCLGFIDFCKQHFWNKK